MKKIILTTFCTLMLCSLLMLVTAGTAIAAEPGYTRVSYIVVTEPTIDGMWTSEDEWTDTAVTMIGEDVSFRSEWYYTDVVGTQWIIEFFSDTTEDAEDLWQFCIDGDQSGGASPQASDYKFEITGGSTLEWYTGVEDVWIGPLPQMSESEIEWAATLSASPTNSTPHWILEFTIVKSAGTVQMGQYWNLYVGVYDASNSEAGVLAWPPTSPDVPDQWGVEDYTMDAIPEGLTFAVMALLTTVSMLVGYKYFIKRKETKTQ